jgi:CRP/FNR family transcriptional regulator, cyclic AMP receptor protein
MQPFELKPITSKLGEIPWLRDVPADECELIEHNTTMLAAPASKILCGEGQPGLDAFIIVSGAAAVIADGRQIAQLTTGDFCGEMALIQGTVRSAHVVALTPMHLLSMSKEEFDLLVRDSPTVNRQIMQSLASRLDDADHAPRS